MGYQIEYGNAIDGSEKAGYIIGDHFEELSKLPGVYTIKQFFKALFEDVLPKHRPWILGQGIDASMRYVLFLYQQHSTTIEFKYDAAEVDRTHTTLPSPFEWEHMQFIDGTSVQAELKLLEISTQQLLTQEFIFPAARELSERACQLVLPQSVLVTKNVQVSCFQRLLPLPIRVETRFQLINNNKRSLKSSTRFYQDYLCAAEVALNFDLYASEEAAQLIYELGKKTFQSFAEKLTQ